MGGDASPILLVSSDRFWLEGLSLSLETAGYQPFQARTRDDAMALLSSSAPRPETAVIDSAMYDRALGETVLGMTALQVAIALRQDGKDLPILFVMSGQVAVLSSYAAGSETIEVLEHAAVTPDMVLAKLDHLAKRPAAAPTRVDWAVVEVSIETERVNFRLSLSNGEVLLDNPVESNLRVTLQAWQDVFRFWNIYDLQAGGVRTLRGDWLKQLSVIGDRLHQQLISEPQRSALEQCRARVHSPEDIHFRFNLRGYEFPDVPFESLRDSTQRRFMREISPLARRIVLQPRESLKDPAATSASDVLAAKMTGRALFIRSQVDGVFRAGNHRFKNEEELTVPSLPQIDEEFRELYRVRRERGLPRPHICSLKAGRDCVRILEDKLAAGPWDIVHYSGHSAAADDDEVFLILPGTEYGTTVGLRVAAFARLAREAGTQLILLSSCESSSPQALFVLAQERIPATIGFRWEVNADEAAQFVADLQDQLAAGKPLGRAFFRAARALAEKEWPAFVSTILLVQSSSWAHADS